VDESLTVTVTDTRTTVSEADSTSGWTATDGPSLFTSNPYPIENTGSLGMQVSNETQDLYYGISSLDMSSGILTYVWTLPQGIMDTTANGGVGVLFYDGSNRIAYHIAGSDKAGFRYDSTGVTWQCQIIDTGNLPSNYTARAGSESSLDWSAITGIGAMYKTLVKSVGGVENCFTDVIRYGNNGLTVTGTVTTTLFDEIATADKSNATGKAYGICRKLGAGLYGLQGPITFGDNSGTGASTLTDTNTTVVFEDRSLGTDKYWFKVVGNSTGSTTFRMGTLVGTEHGTDGCTFICPSGVGASFTANDSDLQYLKLYGCVFRGFNQGFDLSTDATNGPNHEIYDCSFVGCAQIDIGKTKFKNNNIISTTDATGGLLISSTTSLTNVSGLSFTSDGTGHAIYITATGTYTFTDFSYSGYGSTGTTDAVVYNNSGGAVTINVVGGTSPTYRNGSGASTTINNAVTLKLTVKDPDGEPIVGARCMIEAGDDTGSAPFEESVTITSSGGTATVSHSSHGLATGNMVNIRGADQPEYNGAGKVITVTDANTYTYTISGSPASPATGTITSTQCFMSETTTTGGVATESYNSSGTQPYRGRVAYASNSPYYKDVTFSGDDCSGGLDLPIQMQLDE